MALGAGARDERPVTEAAGSVFACSPLEATSAGVLPLGCDRPHVHGGRRSACRLGILRSWCPPCGLGLALGFRLLARHVGGQGIV